MLSSYNKDNKIKIDIVQKSIDAFEKKLSLAKSEKDRKRLLDIIEKEKENLILIKLKYSEELL